MKTVYFVRHGETHLNKERRLQGWNDSPLSDLGEEQARRMADLAAPLGVRKALVSPLGRAQQTASILQAKMRIELETTPELKEVSFGAFEGNTLDQLDEKFPGQWERRQADKWNYRPPEGEANKDAVVRALKVVQRIEEWVEAEPLLIVAHFAINRIILSLLAELEPEDTVRMLVPHETLYRAQNEGDGWSIGYKEAGSTNGAFQTGWLIQDIPTRQLSG